MSYVDKSNDDPSLGPAQEPEQPADAEAAEALLLVLCCEAALRCEAVALR